MHISRIFLSLIIIVHATCQASLLTPEERVTAAELAAGVERACLSQVRDAISRQTGQPMPTALGRWVIEATLSSGYCACVGEQYIGRLNSAALHPNSQTLRAIYQNESAQQCAVDLLKSRFLPYCEEMINEAASSSAYSKTMMEARASVCSCTSTELGPLTPERLQAFTASTVRDYATFQKDGRLPDSSSFSLVAIMNKCGFRELRETIKVGK